MGWSTGAEPMEHGGRSRRDDRAGAGGLGRFGDERGKNGHRMVPRTARRAPVAIGIRMAIRVRVRCGLLARPRVSARQPDLERRVRGVAGRAGDMAGVVDPGPAGGE